MLSIPFHAYFGYESPSILEHLWANQMNLHLNNKLKNLKSKHVVSILSGWLSSNAIQLILSKMW